MEDRKELASSPSQEEGEKDASKEGHSFDELARGVADGTLSRSKALKSVFAAIVGGLLGVSRYHPARPRRGP